MPESTCLRCKKQFTHHYSCTGKYCSCKCSALHRKEEYLQRWLDGEEKGHSGVNNTVSLIIRQYLFEQKGAVCWKCGWGEVNPVSGKTPLQINHIDGDSTNTTPDNLELICPNCHSLTPTYGALNRGKGKRAALKRAAMV